MTVLIGIPLLAFMVILQSAVVSRTPLLMGFPDLALLLIIAWTLQERVDTAWHWSLLGGIFAGIPSALPFGVFIAGYLGTTALALTLRRRLWKIPLMAMLITTIFGSLFTQGLSVVALNLSGSPLPDFDSVVSIFLPSLLLNILLAVPFFLLVNDLAKWLYPKEIEA